MVESFVIVCDVTCDLNDELREKFDIDYVAGTFSYPDGKEEASFLNWNECKNIRNCTSETFYAALKKSPYGFATAPAGIQGFYNAFEGYVKQGKGILALSISSALSGTYGFMEAARKQILENYPEAEIIIVDSRRFASGLGLLAIHASLQRESGKSIKETAEYIENNKNRLHQVGWLDDLSFVAKKGRVTNAAAFFGTLIGIKPVGEFDKNGLTTVIAKIKGEKTAFKILIPYIEAISDDISDQIILIAQSNRRTQAETYKKLIEDNFSPKAVYICDVFPANGINVGPGLMAAYFMGKPISDGLTFERETLKKLMEANK